MTEIPSEIIDLFRDAPFAYFCTVDQENQPHITPMFFFFDVESKSFLFMTSSRSKKVANLHRNNQVSLTIDTRDPANPFENKGAMIQGKAELATLESARPKWNRALVGFFEKYLEFQAEQFHRVRDRVLSYAQQKFRVLIGVTPGKIVYWTGGPSFKVLRFEDEVTRVVDAPNQFAGKP